MKMEYRGESEKNLIIRLVVRLSHNDNILLCQVRFSQFKLLNIFPGSPGLHTFSF